MLTLFHEPTLTANTQTQEENTHTKKFEHMDSDERLELFRKAANALMEHRKSLKSAANRMYLIDPTIYPKGSEKFYKRIRNINSSSVKVYPSVEELKLIFEAYPDELATIREEIGEPSPLEREMQKLWAEVEKLKAWNNHERAQLLKEIRRLEELLKKR